LFAGYGFNAKEARKNPKFSVNERAKADNEKVILARAETRGGKGQAGRKVADNQKVKVTKVFIK
jgi:hypothetical protein